MSYEDYKHNLTVCPGAICEGILHDAAEDPDVSCEEFADLYQFHYGIGKYAS